ncbi:hypothetical protein EVAR_41308_1 [Eumeta japonica]|uniref:Uncharacterized protein n=1 Tax=Eumeta variegata TaxID=151549 RepID=A0A4C1X5D5_EUMVA|nr:hypothetical protein EVAR_41308_1 [Eumeta japonica]
MRRAAGARGGIITRPSGVRTTAFVMQPKHDNKIDVRFSDLPFGKAFVVNAIGALSVLVTRPKGRHVLYAFGEYMLKAAKIVSGPRAQPPAAVTRRLTDRTDNCFRLLDVRLSPSSRQTDGWPIALRRTAVFLSSPTCRCHEVRFLVLPAAIAHSIKQLLLVTSYHFDACAADTQRQCAVSEIMAR